MQHRFDPDEKPKSRGRLAQLGKRNRRMYRPSEAVALWRSIERHEPLSHAEQTRRY